MAFWAKKYADTLDAGEGAINPDVPDAERWVDVPREHWIDCPAATLLPEHRQRYWQQWDRKYGGVRLQNVSTTVMATDVKAHLHAQLMDRMDALTAVLERLERKLG